MNAFPDFQPVDPEISMESAIKAHDTWQTNVYFILFLFLFLYFIILI